MALTFYSENILLLLTLVQLRESTSLQTVRATTKLLCSRPTSIQTFVIKSDKIVAGMLRNYSFG